MFSPTTILFFTIALGQIIFVSPAYASRPLKVSVEQRQGAQVIKFHGGLNKKTPYKQIKAQLKKLIPQKDIVLIIQRGFGGSVREHNKLVRRLKKVCNGSCKIITYLDGQCSSMCTTLYLSGDRRIARDDSFANLAFHRTFTKIGNRTIILQNACSLVTYFSKFDGVNKSYLKENKERLFKKEDNQLSHVSNTELLKAGFSSSLITSKRSDYNELYKFLNID